MEEVWDDINLASLHDHPTELRGIILQDFLARPCNNKDSVSVPTGSVSSGIASPAPPPLATMLTLNTIPERFHFLGNSDPLNQSHSQPQIISPTCCVTVASEGLGKKRFTETDSNLSDDRRHKRMINNRESAARSRARKQAYTNELELEVGHLLEENANLKKQLQQVDIRNLENFSVPKETSLDQIHSMSKLYLAAAAQDPKKQSLRRTSTAPF